MVDRSEVCLAEEVERYRRLGLSDGWEPHLPEPECYVGHGGGVFSRISLRYSDGIPPRGKPEVQIEGPSRKLAAGFVESFDRWRGLRDGSSA